MRWKRPSENLIQKSSEPRHRFWKAGGAAALYGAVGRGLVNGRREGAKGGPRRERDMSPPSRAPLPLLVFSAVGRRAWGHHFAKMRCATHSIMPATMAPDCGMTARRPFAASARRSSQLALNRAGGSASDPGPCLRPVAGIASSRHHCSSSRTSFIVLSFGSAAIWNPSCRHISSIVVFSCSTWPSTHLSFSLRA
jgi:hypothetical protein